MWKSEQDKLLNDLEPLVPPALYKRVEKLVDLIEDLEESNDELTDENERLERGARVVDLLYKLLDKDSPYSVELVEMDIRKELGICS